MGQSEFSSEKLKSTEDIQNRIDALLKKMKEMDSESVIASEKRSDAAQKGKISERSMTMMLFATVISIILISALLVTTTWAWFTESVTTTENSITSAYCTAEVTVEDGNTVLPTAAQGEFIYELSGGVKYTVRVTVLGTGKCGYIRLYHGADADKASYTEVILSDSYVGMTAESDTNSIFFNLTLDVADHITMEFAWGDHGRDDAEILSGGSYFVNKDGVLSEI